MSAAGEFVLKCRRRGVQIHCESDEVFLFGVPADVDELAPELALHLDGVLKLYATWRRARAPVLALRGLH